MANLKSDSRFANASRLMIVLLAASFPLTHTHATNAQSSQPNQQTTSPQPQPNRSGEYLGPTADSIRPYVPAPRDPFKKTVKPRAEKGGGTPRQPRVIGFPTLDLRRAEFMQRVGLARDRAMPEPDPVMQYLVGELEVLGIFKDERGFGAFLRAQPTGTTFFVRRGTRCYNGEIVKIEDDESDIGGAKVIFRETTFVEVSGKQSQQERVVAKPVTVPGKSK